VKLLSLPSVSDGSVFVVGDPDQAIYEWRGANSENMEHQFELDFKGCETMFLNCNYRYVSISNLL
jgi:DNA helicase-2/ATP-dependent DNA helicase PcrA